MATTPIEFEYRTVGGPQMLQFMSNLGSRSRETFQGITTGAARGGKAFEDMGRSAERAGTSVGNFAKAGAAIGVAFAGATAILNAFNDALQSMVEFESELANVSTLVDTTAVSMGDLRQELIAVDAQLGSTSELARGLYQTLSAGIEPAGAIGFVTDAATFATAALTETSTAVDVLSTVVNAYGLEAAEAGRVSDILFETIRRGKTTGEELSRSLGPLIPIASNLQIGIEDVSAAVATLTASGLRTDIAITALRSQFSQFIQNADEFRKAGIDLNTVIGEEGLTGVFTRLRDVTQGNAEELRKFVPDVEGLTATLALAGTQTESFARNLEAIGGSSGSALAGAEKQMGTAAKAMESFNNELDRLWQDIAPLILPTLTAITKEFSLFISTLRGAEERTRSIEDISEELAKVNDELERMEAFGRSGVDRLLASIFGDNSERVRQLRAQRGALEAQLNTVLDIGDAGDDLGFAEEKRVEAAQNLNDELIRQRQIQEEREKREEKARQGREKVRRDEERAAREEEKRIQTIQRGLEEEMRLVDEAGQQRVEAIKASLLEYQRANEAMIKGEEELARETDRMREQARRDQERAEDRAFEDQRDRMREITNTFSEAIFRASQEGVSGMVDVFRLGIERLIQDRIFEPLFNQLADGFSGAAQQGLAAGVQGPLQRGQTRGIGAPTTAGGLFARGGSLGNLALGVGGGIGTAQFAQGLLGGGNFRGSIPGQLFGLIPGVGGTGSNVFGGVGTGALAGATIGSIVPGIGTAIGAGVGAAIGGLAGGLSSLFGGRRRQSSATFLTRAGFGPGVLEDEAQFRTPFGQVGFLNEGTQRFSGGDAGRAIQAVDREIAAFLDDWRQGVLRQALQNQAPRSFRGDTEQDVLAQVIQDRLQTTLGVLAGPGAAADVLGGFGTANAENIQQVTAAFNEAMGVFQQLVEMGRPAENLSGLGQAIELLNDQFETTIDRARELGFAVDDAVAAQARAVEQLRADFRADIEQQILALENPFEAARQALTRQQEERVRSAIDANADLDRIRRLNFLEMIELEKQFAQERKQVIEDSLNLDFTRIRQDRASFEFNIRQQLFSIVDPFEEAIMQLVNAQRTQLEQAVALGTDINFVLDVQRVQQEDLFRRLQDQFGPGNNVIDAFIDNLLGSAQGGEGIRTRIDRAWETFQQALRGTDATAATAAGGNLIDLAREAFASSGSFFDIRDEVIRQLEGFRSGGGGDPRLQNFEAFIQRFNAVEADTQLQSSLQGEMVRLLEAVNAHLGSQTDINSLTLQQLAELVRLAQNPQLVPGLGSTLQFGSA